MLNNIFDHPSAPLPSQEGGEEIALGGHPSIDSGQAWPGRGNVLGLRGTPILTFPPGGKDWPLHPQAPGLRAGPVHPGTM